MQRPTIHLICNAHLDPVWQWRWEEGCAEALSTFGTAVELLAEYPELVFNHNEAVLYDWVRELDPALFEAIRALVRAGRWHIAGGWWLQPDVNLPGAESIVRDIAQGRRFFKEHFDVIPRIAWNFDSFGHSAGLPQILSRAGYVMYIHMRPQAAELALPADFCRWQGADGSEVLDLRVAVGLYHTEYGNLEERLAAATAMALELGRDVPVFWGIGDHGGGATREDLALIERFRRAETRVSVVHSTPERLYEALAPLAANAPVIQGGIQRVFTGCYTSLSRLKRRAAESLAALQRAEALRALTWWHLGQEYPETELQEAWRGHLFNDFHDILPGSCVRSAEEDALDLYGSVDWTVRRLQLEAAVACNRGAPRKAYVPVTVAHASASPGPVPVEVEFMLCLRPKWSGLWHAELHAADGRAVECQEEQPEALLPFNGWRRKLCFMAKAEGIGAAAYTIDAVEGERTTAGAKPALDATFDPARGAVTRLADARGRNLSAGPLLTPLAVQDTGDAWGAEVWRYRDVKGAFELEPRSVVTLAAGPVRTITQAAFKFGKSRVVADTIQYSAWPVIEYRLRIAWNEERMRLKLSVPTVCARDRVLCEVLGGVTELPADGEERVHARWCMLEAGDGAAVGIVNNGQHGFDCLDGELRLSVLRGAAYCHERTFPLTAHPAHTYMDQGLHDVRILVTAGKADEVRAMLPRLADYLHAPPVAYAHLPLGSRTPGEGARAGAFLSIAPANVRLLACKRVQDGDALIVRLQEGAGRACTAHVTLGAAAFDVPLAPQEIATLRIERSGAWRKADLIDER